jgi:hypothetical protein
MHATLAYLNVAGRRAARVSPKCAFLQVMDTLLTTHGASRRKGKSMRAIRRAGKAG